MSSFDTPCKFCGKPLDFGVRFDKCFCGANCRKGWQRRREKLETAKHQGRDSLARLRLLSKKYPDLNPEIIDLLKWMRGEISDLLLLAKDADAMERHVMLSDFSRRRR